MRTESTCGVIVLAKRPLRSAQLHIANRTIVENRISGDVIERVSLPNMAARLANHRHKFAFEIELVGTSRTNQRLVVTGETRCKAREDRRKLRRLEATFRCMIAVVKPDADDLARPH